MSTRRFEDKVAVVTGAANGIGRAIVEKLANEKAILVGIDIDVKALKNLEKEIRKKSKIVTCNLDVSDFDKVKNCIKEIQEKIGNIHILVNNAGVRTIKNAFDYTIDDWQQTFEVNVMSMVVLSNAILPSMMKQRYGKIINMGSIVSKTGETTSIPYCAMKGAVASFTKSMARIAAPYQVYINAIAPHAIDSEFIGYWDDEKRKRIANTIPLKRLGTPEEIANVVLFLASDESSFIVGQTINVNGGYFME